MEAVFGVRGAEEEGEDLSRGADRRGADLEGPGSLEAGTVGTEMTMKVSTSLERITFCKAV